uniref:Reverse transcriptase domain-containing protein n=1 Tax=Tanacetum cinerariifolium TaxID=118510 RepID=A0A6L2NMU6_TANCI|nr:hypothetical protein [Tanacetum cinerariifolium]
MAELLRVPTEGYAEAIVVPAILAEQFELKHSLINMMTSDRFFGLEKDNPHDHIRCALNPADQDSLNAAAGGNLLERRTQDLLTIIENKSKIAKLTHAVNQQTSAITTAMTAILKQFQATPPPAFVKAVEESCVTCGGAHSYYQCLAVDGNTFLELRDNIQGYVSAAAVNYNQGNPIYRPPGMANQIRPPRFAQPNVQNNQNRFCQPQGFNRGNNFNPEQSYQTLTQQNQIVPFNELEKFKRMNEANMKAMQTQINIVKNELRNEMKNSIQAFLSNQTNEIKNMMASLFQMNSASTSGSGSLPSNTVANSKGELKAITTRSGIVLDGPTVPTLSPFINSKEVERVEENLTDPNLSDDPRVPLILGRPFLRTARALIDVHGEERILHDGDERLTLNMRHDTSRYSNQPQKESINLINVFNDSKEDFLEDLFLTNQPSGNPTFSSHRELTLPKVQNDIFDFEGGNVLLEKLLDLDSTKDLHPPLHVNPLSGSTTFSSNTSPLLKELVDELAFITFPPKYDDDLQFDVESDLKMFTDEHAPDYSSPPIFNEYDDDFLEIESDAENVYDDPFDSKGEKIKESKLLIDELDLPYDFLPPFEHDSFISEDFSRVDAKPSTNNEDKVFNPEVPRSKMLLLFSSENKEKVFKPGIHTSEKVHSSHFP